jgi:DNA-binding transcriptional MerR regulator
VAKALVASADDWMTVDQLAAHVGLPVRTIREYQTMRLLPSPQRQGRIGLYGHEHRRRLGLIARLQQRGYSLASIRELLDAWEAGTNLPDLLGVDVGPAALDEAPLRLTRAELSARLQTMTPSSARKAEQAGLITADGPGHFVVRSPALLALVADGMHAGVSLTDMLKLVATLRDQLGALADGLADQIITRVWEPLVTSGRTTDMDAFLRRGRLLLLQGAVSTLADRLGAALFVRGRTAPDGDDLLAAIERVRVGAVADAAGQLHTRKAIHGHR